MRAPDFWWSKTLGARLAATALAPAGFAYGASVAWKHRLRTPYRASVPVICVGNLTVGGTGKTPVAIAVARWLQERGLSPAFLSRGYGRHAAGALLVDPKSHDTSFAGDEALLLSRVAPTVVSPDRAVGARIAERKGANAIIMDDGHQNFSLHKDLSLVVVDGDSGFGNGRMVPAGPLREPVRQGLRRADAVVVMGTGNPPLPDVAGPALRARLVAERRLDGERVVAFAGIGRPQKFFATLRGTGAYLVETSAFADHHAYAATEIAELKMRAARANAALVTTEKDFARLGHYEREGIETLSVRVVFDDAAALESLLAPLIATAMSTS